MLRLSPAGDLQWEFRAYGDMSDIESVRLGHGLMGSTSHGINALTVADLGDGMRVLVTSADRYVYCLDAATGDEVWKFSGHVLDAVDTAELAATRGDVSRSEAAMTEPAGPMWAVKVADISGDGRKEVLVGGGAWEGRTWYYGRLWVLDSEGSLKWHRFSERTTVPSQLEVLDPAGDGRKHIVIAGHCYPYARRFYVYDHEGRRIRSLANTRYSHLASGNIGAGAEERLLVLNLTHEPEIRAFPANSGTPVWTFGLTGDARPLGMVVADFDGDGTEDLFTGHSGGLLYRIGETADGAYDVRWELNLRESLSGASNRSNPHRRRLAAASLTGSGRQLVILSDGTLYVIGGDGTPLVRAELPYGGRMPLGAADLDGGGTESIIVAAGQAHPRAGRGFGKGGFVAAYDLEK